MGTVKTFQLGISPLGQSPRKIYAYLPNGYQNCDRTYPVLYMFDGHNLFFDKTATYGKCWGLKKYLDKTSIPLVVIGQDCNHTGDDRLLEYSPYRGRGNNWFPKEEVYGEFTAKWFAEVLKPYCEKKFRIYSDREHVGIAGSSMGGLMSMYVISAYNSVYSKAACLSSAIDTNYQALQKTIRTSPMSEDTRIYMDFGANEERTKKVFARAIDAMLEISHLYEQKGCNVYPRVIVGGEHSEATWEKAVPVFLEYLYPELYSERKQ